MKAPSKQKQETKIEKGLALTDHKTGNKKVPAEAGTDTPNYREDPDSHKSGRQG